MANEKNVTEKIEEVKVNDTVDKGLIEETDAFSWQRSNAGVNAESAGYETVYPDIGVNLQCYEEPGSDGKVYKNYAVGYMLDINGFKQPQTINFRPAEQRTLLYDMLSAIFNGQTSYPLEIVKTVTPKSDTRPERISYSARVSFKSPDGSKIICPLTTSRITDRVTFNNFIELLKSKAVIE